MLRVHYSSSAIHGIGVVQLRIWDHLIFDLQEAEREELGRHWLLLQESVALQQVPSSHHCLLMYLGPMIWRFECCYTVICCTI